MITDYLVIEDYEPSKLAALVKQAMNDDWQPFGGIAITQWTEDRDGSLTFLYVQAMVKRKAPPNPFNPFVLAGGR